MRYIRKNMMEKKGRFVLVILSIAVSAGLLVTCVGLMSTIKDSFTEPGRKAAEGRDVRLQAGDGRVWFAEEDFNGEGLTDLCGEIVGTGVISENEKISYVSLRGKKEFDAPMVSGTFADENEDVCVISERTAKERGLTVGDSLKMNLNGEPVELRVIGIAVTDGILYADTWENFSVVVPYSRMNALFGADGKYNVMLAKVVAGKDRGTVGVSDTSYTGEASEEEVKDAVKRFNENNTAVTASVLNTLEVFGDLSSLYLSVGCMLAIVVIVSILIISGVFRLIISERLPVFGTFLSQGASKSLVKRIVLLESTVYALIAGIVGSALGEGVLYAVTRYVSPLREYGIYMPFHVDWVCVAAGIAFAVVMSVVASWRPIRSIGTMETKDVILNRVENKPKKHAVKGVVGALLLTFAGVAGVFTHKDFTPLSMAETVAAYVGLVLFLPVLVKGLMSVLCRLTRRNTTMWLSCNNIRTSKLLISNILLLVVALNGILCCAATGTTMTDVVTAAYEEMEYDYSVENILPSSAGANTSEKILAALEANEHVDRQSICPCSYCIGTSGEDDIMILGVDPAAYADYNLYMKLHSEDIQAAYEDYTNDPESILMTTTLARNLKLSEQDTIRIELGGIEHTWRIAVTADAKLYNSGSFVMIHNDAMKNVYHMADVNNICFKVKGDKAAAEESFRGMLAEYGATYRDWETTMKDNVDQNAMVVDLISIFSYIAIAIAAIGIFNNIVICFHGRRKEFAVMASVGMNGTSRRRLILAESLLCVVIAIVVAIPFTLLVNYLVTGMLYYIGVPFDIAFDWGGTPVYLAMFIVIVIISSLSTMRKSANLSVVRELKYE